MSIYLLCLMESTHKFSNELLGVVVKKKTFVVKHSSCFIAFEVQLFVQSSLNKKDPIEVVYSHFMVFQLVKVRINERKLRLTEFCSQDGLHSGRFQCYGLLYGFSGVF